MKKDNLEEIKSSQSLSIGVYIVAAIWIGLGILYLIGNWTKFLALEPNELGDALAGFFAPLAFLWIIAGYFQQGKELQQNTEALNLQHQELKNSVEQQKTLAISSIKQADLFETQMSEQWELQVLSAQPEFEVLQVIESLMGTDHAEITLELRNVGALVSIFDCNSNDSNNIINCNFYGSDFTRPPLSVSTGNSFRVAIYNTYSLKEFTLELRYRDRLRIHQTCLITLRLDCTSEAWKVEIDNTINLS